MSSRKWASARTTSSAVTSPTPTTFAPGVPLYGPIWQTPWSARSTYAQCVEFDMNGPVRIESMFPLGQSGASYYNGTLTPTFDPNFFSMTPVYDNFAPRPFPLFD